MEEGIDGPRNGLLDCCRARRCRMGSRVNAGFGEGRLWSGSDGTRGRVWRRRRPSFARCWRGARGLTCSGISWFPRCSFLRNRWRRVGIHDLGFATGFLALLGDGRRSRWIGGSGGGKQCGRGRRLHGGPRCRRYDSIAVNRDRGWRWRKRKMMLIVSIGSGTQGRRGDGRRRARGRLGKDGDVHDGVLIDGAKKKGLNCW